MTGVAGTFVQIATLPARTNTGSVSFTDTAAVSGVTNTYRVKAVAGLLSSGYSNVVAVIVPSAPAAPTALAATATATSTKNAAVTLTWVDNATNETNFIVQRSTDPTFAVNVTTSTLPANATTLTQTGLARATTYYFRVQATNLGGASAFATVSVLTP